ncbi:hypothetical protein B0A53_02309 [Rhodotorula sp. CCFEE 5036]|nr:hypothetical protein B0A53_02309 [Rhodotorula sp. CCFEE 5036]
MSALTTQMMLSSMLGYIALGAAIAAFMPAVITNAVNRRSQTGPGFLAVWLLADIANLVGIILLGAAVTQVALAAWYFIIDGIMLVQLLFYGHDDLRKYGRPPRKASALARIHERGHLGQSLTRQFEEFSPWDDVKLLGFCVAGGIAAWGIYMTLGLYANPETFAIKIPEGFHPLSFGLGMAAIAIFTAARIPEIWSGYQHLLAELPFILGAVLPIIFDAAMLFAIQSWHRRWEKSKTRAARDEEKEANQELDLLDEERRCVVALMELEELEQTVKAKRDKLKHLDDSTEAKEKHELNVELEHLQRDILVNQTALQKLENKIRERFDAAIDGRPAPTPRNLNPFRGGQAPHEVFIRAYALGYTAQVVPACMRALLSALKHRYPIKSLLRQLALALWLASWDGDEGDSIEREKKRRRIRAAFTYLSASIASFAAILLLQSKRPSARQTSEAIEFVVTPYSPLSAAAVDKSTASVKKDSPTLDLTLLVFVRAADTLARFVYERTATYTGRKATIRRLLAENGDTALFCVSSYQIMRCWFNKPHLLPSAYSNWILRLARMDPNVLQLLRYAWEGRFVYGQKADADVLKVCENAATRAGLPLSAMDPSQIRRIDCSVVHHSIGGGTCEQNALKRWIWAFLDALAIYLPVHAIPPLLFNFRRVLSQPGMSAKRILQAACRSSAFLATFVASIYAAVCLVRTRLPQAIASIPQQPLDGGLAVQLGCLVCGLSVLIENKHRRKEMALYTAPRALYALLDETFPASLLSSPLGQQVGTWLERLVFSLSSGAVLTAAVHRPDLVSGVVRGVTSFAVGSWGKPDSR